MSPLKDLFLICFLLYTIAHTNLGVVLESLLSVEGQQLSPSRTW